MAVDEEVVDHAKDDEGCDEPEGDAMEFAAHERFVLSGFDAEPGEHTAPEARAKQRVE